MPLFDFIQNVGSKFESERQKALETSRKAASDAQAAERAKKDAADAADAEAAAEEAARLDAEYNDLMIDALNEHVATLGVGDDQVQIMFSSGVVTLIGAVPDADTREKLVLAVGNVYGVEQVDDQLVVPDAPEPVFYTVKKGDTLSKISAQHYGQGSLFRIIFEANNPMLKNPDRIYVGQVLRIPPHPED